MNQRPVDQLDSFETALLAQLKGVVAATGAADPDSVAGEPPVDQLDGWRRPRTRRFLVAAATVGVLATVATTYGLWPTPAYAVGGNSREVTVRVMRLEEAAGLERALEKRGINADITYLAEDQQCAPGRYAAVDTPGLALSVNADAFVVTIPKDAVGPNDTFVLSAAVVPISNGFKVAMDYGIAHGPVAPCHVI